MSFRFDLQPHPQTSEIRLLGPSGPVSFDRWSLDAPASLLPGVELAYRLESLESAAAENEVLLVGAETLAGLSAAEAQRLGLPPLAAVVARLSATGLFTQPGYRIALDWTRPTGQAIVGAERSGPWLQAGGELRRLPDTLYAIAEAIERVNGAGELAERRLAALANLRELLPAGAEKGIAEASGLLGQIHIAVADAFSLDLRGDEEHLAPVLHRAQGDPDQPLLPPERQGAFERRFNSVPTLPTVYALGAGWYVVPQPPLRRALSVVRRMNVAPAATRRAFFANPRAYLRDELGEETELVAFDSLFRETAAYADRVTGLGLWRKRILPWIQLQSTNWLGDVGQIGGKASAPRTGLMIDDQLVALTAAQARQLEPEIERAIAEGAPFVMHGFAEGSAQIPAQPETLAALAEIAATDTPRSAGAKPETLVLLIKPNEEQLDIEVDLPPLRDAPALELPLALKTILKPHQSEGLLWLQKSWTAGLPGVLLADDMGLGKTLQGLAFLAWLREGMRAGVLRTAPLLVVAPTGLLHNWRAEHDKHLAGEGLGRCAELFGDGLAALRKRSGALTSAALADTNWALTTYETLRDYDREFGQIPFAAALFDEAQKIKTPGARITDAAKAMNVEFRIAMTGTPVENRLADLWCITDGVHPGLLDDLKAFSARYERHPDPERLRRLKSTLDRPLGGRPPVMLRRLKEDRLPELPPVLPHLLLRMMPDPQREAYEAVISDARTARQPGAMLEALQKLRAISLHPGVIEGEPDAEYVARSARLQVTFETLDVIADKGEKVLLFVDDLDLQARIAGLLHRRYRMARAPALINGAVDGARRQARVDAFQASGDGFEAIILSPRAGGVGLTLTRANHVLHLSRWWNPAVEDQCTGRAHRIGQTRPVHVHLPISTLSASASFDENLNALLTRKRHLMRETLMPPEADSGLDTNELFRATVC